MSDPKVTILSVEEGETMAQMVDLPLADESDSLAVSTARVAIDGVELPRPVPVIAFSGNLCTGETLTAETGVSGGVPRDADDIAIVTLDDMTDVVAAVEAAGMSLADFQAELEDQLERRKEVSALREMVRAEIRAILQAREAAAEELA